MYARIHGTITWHRKTLAATDAALGVWVRLLGHCAEHLTDGFVPEATARAVSARSPKALASLLQAGLISETSGGFQLANYLEHNASRSQIEAGREATRNRVKRSRNGVCNAVTTPVTNAVTNGVRTALVTPAVTPAVTLQEVEVEEEVEEERDTSGSRPTASPSKVDSDDVRRVFEHWRTKLGHERAVLDDKRRRKIIAALKSHGLETALRAIDGCAASDFHMGRDERSGGKRYDDLELILRNASKIESFAALAPKAPAPQTKGSAARRDWLSEWPEHVRHDGPKWTPPSPNRGGNRDGA